MSTVAYSKTGDHSPSFTKWSYKHRGDGLRTPMCWTVQKVDSWLSLTNTIFIFTVTYMSNCVYSIESVPINQRSIEHFKRKSGLFRTDLSLACLIMTGSWQKSNISAQRSFFSTLSSVYEDNKILWVLLDGFLP